MACLEGLPVARKGGPAGPRPRARARSAHGGSLHVRSLGGTRGPGMCLAPGPVLPAPRRPAAYTRPGNHTAGKSHEASAAGGPVRGVRAAGPARADGRDAARFAAAAAAYTALRTGFGRTEALADLARPAGVRRWLPARVPGPRHQRPARATRRETAGPGPRRWRPAADGERRRRRPAAGLVAGRWWSRVRRGRPARLALRIAAAAVVS